MEKDYSEIMGAFDEGNIVEKNDLLEESKEESDHGKKPKQ